MLWGNNQNRNVIWIIRCMSFHTANRIIVVIVWSNFYWPMFQALIKGLQRYHYMQCWFILASDKLKRLYFTISRFILLWDLMVSQGKAICQWRWQNYDVIRKYSQRVFYCSHMNCEMMYVIVTVRKINNILTSLIACSKALAPCHLLPSDFSPTWLLRPSALTTTLSTATLQVFMSSSCQKGSSRHWVDQSVACRCV